LYGLNNPPPCVQSPPSPPRFFVFCAKAYFPKKCGTNATGFFFGGARRADFVVVVSFFGDRADDGDFVDRVREKSEFEIKKKINMPDGTGVSVPNAKL